MEKSLLRQSLRNHIRLRRRALSPQQQTAAAQRVVSHVMNHPRIHSARTLAVFLSFDGELDTRPLIDALWAAGKQVYLPVLHPFTPGHLLFMRYTAATPLVLNRLRIRNLSWTSPPYCRSPAWIYCLRRWWRLISRDSASAGAAASMTACCNTGGQQVAEPLPVEQCDIGLPEIITPSRHWRWHDAGVKKNG